VAESRGLEVPVTAVTVFGDGARVVRRGPVSVSPGLLPVVIGNLPAAVDPASVRVAARGRGLALLDVEVHRGYGADPFRDETARLRSEVESRHDEVQALDDEDAAEQARLRFFGEVSQAAAAALARALSFGRAGHDDLSQMAGLLSADTASTLARRRDISARRRAAQRELDAAEQRLAAAEQFHRSAEFVEVSATLEAAAATEAEVELSYHVSGASWRPLYDLSLTGDRLAVSYLAEITQETGEDWPAVELALSTTRRGRHQRLPELDPWYIGRPAAIPRAMPPAGLRARSFGAADDATAAPLAAAAAAGSGAQAPEAAPLAAVPGESGAGLLYRVARPLTVPADGGPHKTMVARFDLDVTLDYLAVPVLGPEAYLRATATNGSSLLLLPGPARVFHDQVFVGETTLETVAAGEEFEVQLGVDDQIRVERQLRRHSTSKAVLGGTRTIDIGYEITVRNHRPNTVKVRVHDHIPVSEDGAIKVRPRELSPDPAEQNELGELIWDLSLEGGQSGTIRYRFTVEHPAQVTVVGL
jgi:uncharacterized protein (TIGR02231 family)